jgi:hypothetical protein
MKIFEVINNIQTENKADELPDQFDKGQVKKLFPKGGIVPLGSTDAADLKYKGLAIGNVFVPVYDTDMKSTLRQSPAFYILFNKTTYIKIDPTEPEGKKISTAIVNALLKQPPKLGLIGKMKDKLGNLTDPDDPTSSAYTVTSNPNAARGAASTLLTRGAGKLDKMLGLQK